MTVQGRARELAVSLGAEDGDAGQALPVSARVTRDMDDYFFGLGHCRPAGDVPAVITQPGPAPDHRLPWGWITKYRVPFDRIACSSPVYQPIRISLSHSSTQS